MQRLLMLAVAIAATACATTEPTTGDASADASRVVAQTLLPLRGDQLALPAGDARRTFAAPTIEGWLDRSGTWSLRAEVEHPRLRCATYETGIRLGRGDAACNQVEWQSGPDFATRRLHCNGATLVHSGGGRVELPQRAIDQANCVGVLVRCSGSGC